MLIPISRHLRPTSRYPFSYFIKHFNSKVLAIKNASSPNEVLELFSQMHHQSIPLDTFSVTYALKSCTHLHNLIVIQHLHSHILKSGFISNVYVASSLLHAYVITSFVLACKLFDELPNRNTVTWNTMIKGYSNCGNVNKAYDVFVQMPVRNIACWSAMISAYLNGGFFNRGFDLFREMVGKEGLKPHQVTIGTVLSGCAHMGSIGLLMGKSAHGYIVRCGWDLQVEMGTILVDMYAKCGFLKYASLVFQLMKERNVMSWTALICGLARHGDSKGALSLFEVMRQKGVKPNQMTITGVLSACAHTGLVDEGRKFFDMIEEFELEPRIQHYGCMVDLFCKAGLLEEACEVIRTMNFEPNIFICGSFLAACKEYKQFEMAERMIDKVLRMLMPENDGGIFPLICDLYALNEKWDDAERVRDIMLNQNVRKARGSSFMV